MMILFGLMFMILMFITPWGWWFDIHVLNHIGEWLDLPVWFSRAALKVYWLIVAVLFVAALYYPEE